MKPLTRKEKLQNGITFFKKSYPFPNVQACRDQSVMDAFRWWKRGISMSVPWDMEAHSELFHFAFSVLLYFPRKANILGCKKIGKLSGAYFVLDIVPFPSQQGHTFSLPQPDRAPPVAYLELLLLRFKGNLFQVPKTLLTHGQICAIYRQVQSPSLYRSPF